jgi:hypothetical protein
MKCPYGDVPAVTVCDDVAKPAFLFQHCDMDVQSDCGFVSTLGIVPSVPREGAVASVLAVRPTPCLAAQQLKFLI